MGFPFESPHFAPHFIFYIQYKKLLCNAKISSSTSKLDENVSNFLNYIWSETVGGLEHLFEFSATNNEESLTFSNFTIEQVKHNTKNHLTCIFKWIIFIPEFIVRQC